MPDKFLVDGDGGSDGNGDARPSGDIVWIRSLSSITAYGLASGPAGLTMSGGITVPGDLGGGMLMPAGTYDMVVAGFAEADAAHIYSVRHGDVGEEFGFLDVTESTGAPMIYGLTGGTSYDVGLGSTVSAGGTDGFIGKYGSSNPSWVNRIYGALDDKILTSARGTGSTVYAGGFFEGTPTWNGQQLTSAGGRDGFLTRMNTFTGVIDLTKQYGGPGRDEVAGMIAVSGGLIMTGSFDDTIDFGGTATPLTSSAGLDMYIAKLDNNGNGIWAVRYGGAGDEREIRVAVDAAGDLYLTGSFQQDLVLGTTTLTSNGGFDVFIAKLSGSDGSPIWAKSWGATGDDADRGIVVDARGRVVIPGWSVGALDSETTLGGTDAVVASYATSDGELRWRHVTHVGRRSRMANRVRREWRRVRRRAPWSCL